VHVRKRSQWGIASQARKMPGLPWGLSVGTLLGGMYSSGACWAELMNFRVFGAVFDLVGVYWTASKQPPNKSRSGRRAREASR